MRTPPPRRPQSAGFTLIAVLLAVGVMAGLVTAYGRHVVVSGRGSMASPQLLASREACHSGLTLARQAILSGEEAVPATIPAGDGLAGISVVETESGHQQLSIESLGEDGLGARRTAQLGAQSVPASDPADPASLPTLSAPTVAGLLANPLLPKHHITESTTLQGVELSGLLVVHAGVQLNLSDVVLHGTLMSSSVLEQVSYGAYDLNYAPRVVLTGNVRIDPPDELPGLAVLMPDGRMTSAAVDARMQIHGDVIAHSVSLLHEGVLSGHVMGVEVSLADAELLDRVGFERKQPAWSPALNLGVSSEPLFLAIVPPSSDLGSLAPIMDYWQADGAP
jgi:hypothetical protein